MKGLSLWQPWASLVAMRAKLFETRSWGTDYRGPLAIHAALKWNSELYWLCLSVPFWGRLREVSKFPSEFYYQQAIPFGKVVAIVDLVDVVPVEQVRDSLSEEERAFGDYSDGRFAWRLENIRALATPYDMRGRQGLFNIGEHDLAELCRAA